MHAYTEPMRQAVSRQPLPREAIGAGQRCLASDRLSLQTQLVRRLSQPLHPVAIGSSQRNAAIVRHCAPLDQVVRAGS